MGKNHLASPAKKARLQKKNRGSENDGDQDNQADSMDQDEPDEQDYDEDLSEDGRHDKDQNDCGNQENQGYQAEEYNSSHEEQEQNFDRKAQGDGDNSDCGGTRHEAGSDEGTFVSWGVSSTDQVGLEVPPEEAYRPSWATYLPYPDSNRTHTIYKRKPWISIRLEGIRSICTHHALLRQAIKAACIVIDDSQVSFQSFTKLDNW